MEDIQYCCCTVYEWQVKRTYKERLEREAGQTKKGLSVICPGAHLDGEREGGPHFPPSTCKTIQEIRRMCHPFFTYYLSNMRPQLQSLQNGDDSKVAFQVDS